VISVISKADSGTISPEALEMWRDRAGLPISALLSVAVVAEMFAGVAGILLHRRFSREAKNSAGVAETDGACVPYPEQRAAIEEPAKGSESKTLVSIVNPRSCC